MTDRGIQVKRRLTGRCYAIALVGIGVMVVMPTFGGCSSSIPIGDSIPQAIESDGRQWTLMAEPPQQVAAGLEKFLREHGHQSEPFRESAERFVYSDGFGRVRFYWIRRTEVNDRWIYFEFDESGSDAGFSSGATGRFGGS